MILMPAPENTKTGKMLQSLNGLFLLYLCNDRIVIQPIFKIISLI